MGRKSGRPGMAGLFDRRVGQKASRSSFGPTPEKCRGILLEEATFAGRQLAGSTDQKVHLPVTIYSPPPQNRFGHLFQHDPSGAIGSDWPIEWIKVPYVALEVKDLCICRISVTKVIVIVLQT